MFDRWSVRGTWGEYLVTTWLRAHPSERQRAISPVEALGALRTWLYDGRARHMLCDVYRAFASGVDFSRLSTQQLGDSLAREIADGRLLVLRAAAPVVGAQPPRTKREGSEKAKARKQEAIKPKYTGTLVGPAGPLKNWPFILKRNGETIDDRSLFGRSSNAFRNGTWLSGQSGRRTRLEEPDESPEDDDGEDYCRPTRGDEFGNFIVEDDFDPVV